MAKAPKEGDTSLSDLFAALDLQSQRDALKELQTIHDGNVQAKREELLAQLELLGGAPKPVRAPQKAGDGERKRAAPKPKYRSLKDPSITWSGRGATASWLKAEMAETGKGLDEFLIRD